MPIFLPLRENMIGVASRKIFCIVRLGISMKQVKLQLEPRKSESSNKLFSISLEKLYH